MSTSRINAAGVQYVRDHLSHVPRPDREASRAIRQWLKQQGHDLDPEQIDVVTLHYCPDGPDSNFAAITQSMSLPQAVLGNWQGESNNDLFGALLRQPWAGSLPDGSLRLVETLPAPGFNHQGVAFEVFNGLFRRTTPQRYDASTHLPIAAEAFQRFIEALDFHTPFKAQLDRYWGEHLHNHRLACKLNFIAACNQQVAEGSLSEAARKLIWQAAGLMPRGITLRLSMLNIYGYAATDLLYLHHPASDLGVLYIPGNSSPLLEFSSQMQLQDWVGQQCKDPLKRRALKQHFRLADCPQGLDFSGLDTALEGLAEYPRRHQLPPEHGYFNDDGTWPPRTYVNYRPDTYSPRIDGDLFQALAERQRQRSYDDADFLITRDSQVSKARWLGYLTTTLNLLAPLCLVVPGLAPLLAVGGIAQLGLGLDQAINGKTLQEKQDGVGNITWGLLNAAPLAIVGATRAKALFEFKTEGFVPPTRLNEQIGYPLSPVSPPRFPEPEGARYFHTREPIAPLPDGDQAITDSVIRTPLYNSDIDNLDASIDTYNERVVYDLQRDVFIREQDLNEIDPVGYVARVGIRDLQPVRSTRTVTNAMRSRSLRALGIDLALPVEIPTVASASYPIPKRIACLWVGDKVISPELLANLGSNAERLNDSQYNLRLYLSSAAPAAYAENLSLLAEHAPDLQVLPLEEQAFYRAFRQSRYYAQYDAALDGNGGIASNYASASDVLRYPMLHHEGGLYMDVDDTLLATGETIDQVELRTTPNGLLLAPPMSNEKMGMNCLYNTSLIGSHPGNPTLEAISEEMHARYQTNQDFYDSKPSLADDPANFYRYANRLSRMTGPAMLSDVVDRHLPALRTLRQVINLYGMPRINAYQFVDLARSQEAMRTLLPLNRFAKVGGNHSWSRT
ncbi:dermonecrotic toxin domain-containing protein [Pseudomonas sp. NPDC089392]|uniref:dermonecrotic toxin domain-containing protein n=1 Tax=Pseudomonas sp. NPDC089392 TaxID=3364459 RepID=UPI003828E230